jgi:hypothetical protein
LDVNESIQVSVVLLDTGGEVAEARGKPTQQGLPNHPITTPAVPGAAGEGKRTCVPNS